MEKLDWGKLEGWDRTLAHMWEIAFGPELERRKRAGLVEDDFYLYIAQFLQTPDGKTKVLFNEEVRGTALIESSHAFTEGQAITIDDLTHVENFDLPDDLLDCGHFTVFRAGAGWRIVFNFLSGRAKARDMFELADQYLQASITSSEKGYAGPAVDNLYSAAELVSKAELILHRSAAAKSKSHGMIASEINAWARLGNIEQAFVALFNKLGQQRPNARYGDKENRPSIPNAESYDLVRAMIERGIERVASSIDPKSRYPK